MWCVYVTLCKIPYEGAAVYTISNRKVREFAQFHDLFPRHYNIYSITAWYFVGVKMCVYMLLNVYAYMCRYVFMYKVRNSCYGRIYFQVNNSLTKTYVQFGAKLNQNIIFFYFLIKYFVYSEISVMLVSIIIKIFIITRYLLTKNIYLKKYRELRLHDQKIMDYVNL